MTVISIGRDTPIVTGTTVPIKAILDALKANWTIYDIAQCYPPLTVEMIGDVLDESVQNITKNKETYGIT